MKKLLISSAIGIFSVTAFAFVPNMNKDQVKQEISTSKLTIAQIVNSAKNVVNNKVLYSALLESGYTKDQLLLAFLDADIDLSEILDSPASGQAFIVNSFSASRTSTFTGGASKSVSPN